MRKAVLDENRTITDTGWILQTNRSHGNQQPIGTYYRPAIGTRGRRKIWISGKSHIYSRVVWSVFNGPIGDGLVIDHIDGDKTNDRLSNLRKITDQKNKMAFRSAQSGSTSSYRGVYFHKPSNKWCVSIRSEGVAHHLGSYDNEAEAAKAYDKKAIELGFLPEALNFKEEYIKAELRTVYAERKRLQEKKDNLWAICERWHNEDGEQGMILEDEVSMIFNGFGD